jgi:hypothetical protein
MRPDTIFTDWLLCRALTSALLGRCWSSTRSFEELLEHYAPEAAE